jgi:hypothetical protein
LAAVARYVPASLLVLLALALPAPASAKPALTIKTPAAGDMTLAHVVITTKGATGAPKLPLANKKQLSKSVTIAGGVKKLKKNSFLASFLVAHKTGGKSGKAPAFNLVAPKGVTSWKLKSQFARNLLGSSLAPKFCSATPPSFGYVSKKPLAGSAVPRFSTQALVSAGYSLDCPAGYDDFETQNLQAALRGQPQPTTGPGSGGGDGGEDGEEDGEGEYGGVPASQTLQGSGTVFDEGGGVFRYEITFNEPLYQFDIEAGAPVRCPTDYGEWKAAECDTLEGSQSVAPAGVNMPCHGGEFSFQLYCSSPSTKTKPPSRPTVPAGTKIVGRYKIDAGGAVAPGEVKVIGWGPSGKSAQFTLSGP